MPFTDSCLFLQPVAELTTIHFLNLFLQLLVQPATIHQKSVSSASENTNQAVQRIDVTPFPRCSQSRTKERNTKVLKH
jgi:hypothetical protein